MTDQLLCPWVSLPKAVEAVRLKRTVSLVNRKTTDTTRTYVGLENIEPWTGRFIVGGSDQPGDGIASMFEAGDVLFGKLRPYLAKVALAESAGRCTSELLVLRSSAVHPRFLQYVLLTEPFIRSVDASTFGSKMPRAEWEFIAQVFVPVPAEPSQRRIASFLDRKTAAIDALIAKKERLVELLLEKRQATITEAVTSGIEPNVPMKESGFPWLGKTPSHWTLLRLKQLSHRISGRLVYQPAQYFSDEGIPFIMGNNITERGIVLEQTKFIPPEVNARFAHHALRSGDVVMVRVGAPGVTAVVGPQADGLNCGSLMIVRRNDSFYSTWLAAVMNSPVVRAQIDLVQYGAAQEQINITDAVNFWIPTPPMEEQRRISAFVEQAAKQVNAAVDKVVDQVARLREYRQALITDAVTGKIDVSTEAA